MHLILREVNKTAIGGLSLSCLAISTAMASSRVSRARANYASKPTAEDMLGSSARRAQWRLNTAVASSGIVMAIRSLPAPLEIDGDPEATEMIRVWLAHDDVHVSLLLGMWADAEDCEVDEREAWGHLLSDVAQHVAHGMAQSHGWEQRDALARIKQAFLENIEHQERRLAGGYVG